MHTKAETTIKEKEPGSLEKSGEHVKMQRRMHTAFKNIVRASDLHDNVKRELAGPTPPAHHDLDLFSN